MESFVTSTISGVSKGVILVSLPKASSTIDLTPSAWAFAALSTLSAGRTTLMRASFLPTIPKIPEEPSEITSYFKSSMERVKLEQAFLIAISIFFPENS